MNNTSINELFFELIQTAVGNREELSRVPTVSEWLAMYKESERQAITGVMVYGLERLPQEQRPGQELLLQWIGISEQIRQGNLSLTKHCKQLQQKICDLGHKSSILKGQGVALYYDEPFRALRQSGDIDIFVGGGLKGAIELAHQLGADNPGWDYKHLHLDIFADAEVEMHYRVEVLLNLWKNRRLQKWFDRNKELLFNERDGLVTPTISFNLFYILLHTYRHFLYEGVGMRQLMDYYYVLKCHSGSQYLRNERAKLEFTDNTDILNVLRYFDIMRFARGVMWIMQEVFRLERKYMICEPLESEGRFILGEVMAGGNFGHYDQRLTHGGGKLNTVKQVFRHNWHLMGHYPLDVFWVPIWFVWHKCWKLRTRALLAIRQK